MDTSVSNSEAMMAAYRALRDNSASDAAERNQHLLNLLSGTNPAWAWFALRELELSASARSKLCRIVARSGNGESMLWVLEDVRDLPLNERNALIEALIGVKVSYFAMRALEKILDLNPHQQKRLENIALGLDPDQK